MSEIFANGLNVNVNVLPSGTPDAGMIEINISPVHDGAPGKSAYEIAVDHGFEGTEEEWLDSLKGGTGIEDVELDDTLTYKDGRLAVNTANELDENNMLPITSAAAYAVVGNIHEILKTV